MSYVISISIAKTGRNVSENHIVSIGAALIGSIDSNKPILLDTFLAYLKMPLNKTWENTYLDEYWYKNMPMYVETRSIIEDTKCQEIASAMKDFTNWIFKVSENRKVVIVADNSESDISWLDKYLCSRSSSYILGYYKPILDLSSFYSGIAKCDIFDDLTNPFESVCKRLDVSVEPIPECSDLYNTKNKAINIGISFSIIYRKIFSNKFI